MTVLYGMPQLHVTNEAITRMKTITGINHPLDGDYMVNEMIDILEKKLRDQR